MKIVQLNATCGIGSTGKICTGISRVLSDRCIENYIIYSSKTNGHELGIKCSDDRYIKLQAAKSRIFGNYGYNSSYATKKIIKELKCLQPDIVHLHNIHGHDCNLKLLFNYFKEHNTKIVWTFHDCWAFTGYCPHFTMIKCDKWKTQCFRCAQIRNYSWFFDRSKAMYERKKELFKDLDLTIVTPSKWLADLVKQSFLKEYPVHIINNGIDLDVFKLNHSDFRHRYNLTNKKIVLGVSFGWGTRKGLDIFINMAQKLPDNYQIVLVGTNCRTDKLLPSNILSIHRTNNQQELAEIYSEADVFVNPTREENYPTVNMESIACGTPVITFNTGGSPEMIDEHCGSVIENENFEELKKEVIRVCEEKPFSQDYCIEKAKTFDMNQKFQEYIAIYEEICSE